MLLRHFPSVGARVGLRNASLRPDGPRLIQGMQAHRPRMSTTSAAANQAERPVVIAVDGPAASGKGTLARRLARACNLAYLDTGLLYRAVALKALEGGVPLGDEDRLAQIASQLQSADLTASPELRSERVGSAASKVSALPAVRRAVDMMPRAFVKQLPPGVAGSVLDGRDVGTAMFPEAQLKIFLVASPEVRAQRRLAELHERGEEATLEGVLQGVLERDARDSARAVAPLKPASDAHLLDSSELGPEAVLQAALQLVRGNVPQLLTPAMQQ